MSRESSYLTDLIARKREEVTTPRQSFSVTRENTGQFVDQFNQISQAKNEMVYSELNKIRSQKPQTTQAPKMSDRVMPQSQMRPNTDFLSDELGQGLDAKAFQKSYEQGVASRNLVRKIPFLGKLLLGQSEEQFTGEIDVNDLSKPGDSFAKKATLGIGNTIRERGIAKTMIFPYIQRMIDPLQTEKYFEGRKELIGLGYSPTEANELSRQYALGDQETLPVNVKNQLDKLDFNAMAWGVLDLFDLAGMRGRFAKGLGNAAFREIIVDAAGKNTASEMREVLLRVDKNLAGTQELEDLVTTIRTMKDPSEVRTVASELSDLQRQTRTQVAATDTLSDTVRTGAPTRRLFGTADTTEGMQFLDELRAVFRGESEAARLSNASVLADEVRTGTLPFSVKPTDTTDMFRSFEAKKLTPGDRVSFNKEAIEQIDPNAQAVNQSVKLEDVVRMKDGSFVYAPKSALTKGIKPTLRGIQKAQRPLVERADIARTAKRLQAEENARIAKQAEIAQRAQKEIEVNKAKRLLSQNDNEKTFVRDRTASLRSDKKQAVTTFTAQNKKATENLTLVRKERDVIADSIAKKVTKIKRLRESYQKKINAKLARTSKTKAENKAEADKLRKERDKEIKKVTKERDDLRSALTKKNKAVRAAEDKVDFKPKETIARIESEYAETISAAATRASKEFQRAKSIVDDVSQQKVAKETAAVRKKDAEMARDNNNFSNEMAEDLKVTDAKMREVFNIPDNVDSGGKQVKTQIIDGFSNEFDLALQELRQINPQAGVDMLPATHQVLSDKAAISRAISTVSKDPEAAFDKFIRMEVPTGSERTTHSALAMALMQTKFVRSNALRLKMMHKAFEKTGTFAAQELRSRQKFSRFDYLNVVEQLTRNSEKNLGRRGINLPNEVASLESQVTKMLKTVEKDVRVSLSKVIDEIKC